MGAVYRHVYLLLIIAMCGLKAANTSNTEAKKTLSGWLDKPPKQNSRFPQAACKLDQGDKSAVCKGSHLTRVPMNIPPNTKKLNLAENEINILFNTSFEPYSNLVTLDLRLNDLTTIQSAAFQPLKHLESLDLSENPNLVLPTSVPFQPLKALVTLLLKVCNLEDLPNDLMDSFPNLRELDLSGNRLSSLNVSTCKTGRLDKVILLFNRFESLAPDNFIFVCPTYTFWLFDNPIRYISEDAIAALPVDMLLFGMNFSPTASMLFNLTSGVARSTIGALGILRMDLHYGIPVGVFKPLQNYKGLALSIRGSGELSLYNNVFFGLSFLALDLSFNAISEIEPDYFRGMSRLRVLSLVDNQILHFNRYNTTWESNMTHLDLSKNQLHGLYSYQFRGLNNLTSLNISRNENLILLDFRYGELEKLEILDVTGTMISILELASGLTVFYFLHPKIGRKHPLTPGYTFRNSYKLKVLNISYSQLNRINLWDSYSSRSLFKGLINLLVLHMSNNPLGSLPDRVFADNSLLKILVMNNCEISSLIGTDFEGLHSLVYLYLHGNNLLFISSNTLMYLSVLEALIINDNKIMYFEEGAIENVPHIKILRMSNNQLVAFNRSTWSTLMSYNMDSVDISRNPFVCRCSYDWLYDLANSSEMVLHQNETICSIDSLSHLRERPLLEFDPSKYCVPNIVLISTLPFVGLALLIGLLLAFHNRWLIRYKLFLVKLAVIGYREMQDAREHDDFIYDINIMFTEEDEAWARELLRPSLEERLPDYDRYSFGDDNLILGMYYLDAVHYAVEHSFKTILLISRRAVRDNWFLIKFRIAMEHVNDEQTENTTVIFLEDIPEHEIPFIVRLYLSDRRPYMRWPEDVRGREYFWKKLSKVVTFNLRGNPLIPPE